MPFFTILQSGLDLSLHFLISLHPVYSLAISSVYFIGKHSASHSNPIHHPRHLTNKRIDKTPIAPPPPFPPPSPTHPFINPNTRTFSQNHR